MKRDLLANGYRATDLPVGLSEMEQKGSLFDKSITLIAADDVTLLWNQQLESGESAVFKMYRHRGAISWLREQRWQFRVEREFNALTQLAKHKIPCSVPLFWFFGQNAIYGRYEILVTREIPEVLPVSDFLQSHPEKKRLEKALTSLAKNVQLMHQSGIHHGALLTRNILVHPDPPQPPLVYVIDMPKAISFPKSIIGTRMATIDLLNLLFGVARECNQDSCAKILAHYGMPKKTSDRFMETLKKYNPSKHTRNLNRAECEFREFLAYSPFRTK